MNKLFTVMCVAALSLLATGCEKSEAARKQEEARRVQFLKEKVIGKIQYIKDVRTGLCFAYIWGGAANGGPALTTVPCEAIPPELLNVMK